MKVSLNTIKQYIDFDLPSTEDLESRINERLGKVEKVTYLGAKYDGAVIVKVVSAEKHPNADKLSVCLVDDAGHVADVPRDEKGYVQVVCGAPNVHADMFAIWLPPNCTVPASFDDPEPFVLSARELRGVVSQGMLAAADELAVGSDHNGIIELTDADLHPGSDVKALEPGLDFANTFGLNDTVLELENKMFTHRPDCFGQIGVAREIAGILGYSFTSPNWYLDMPQFKDANGLDVTVFNHAGDKVPRFMAVAMKGVVIKPSPFWLQAELVRLGSKAINNIVDVTNYVMLLTGQPTHAYDYDKLRGATLGARMAVQGEAVTLLNGKSYELTTDDIVIVDGEGVVGLGGVMGGGNSEVSDTTTNIVLEVATFDMYAIRKTSMRHGLFTDAVTRFNKGQSPLQNSRIMNLLIMSVSDVSSAAEQASSVYDLSSDIQDNARVSIRPQFVIDRLGERIENSKIIELLTNVEFSVNTHTLTSSVSFESNLTDIRQTSESNTEEDAMYFVAPFWRTDIELPEDIVEEIGRLYGFDKLPKELPKRSVKPVAKNTKREVAHLVRESLVRSGANEVLTYSFVHKNVIDRAGQDATKAFQLGNALSPDLQYYRLSVLPSLLDKVHGDIKAGYNEFALFEIGKAHNKDDMDGDLPGEFELVDAVYASKKPGDGAPYYHVRTIATQLAHDLGFTLKFTPVNSELSDLRFAPFEPTRSAMVTSRKGELLGVIGEFKQRVAKAFKLPDYSAGMSLSLEGLANAHAAAGAVYSPLSRFPSVTQDISLRVAVAVTYEDVFWTVWSALQDYGYELRITPVSIYQAEGADTKTITLSLKFTSHDKTLASGDVSPLIAVAADLAKQKLSAELA